MLLDDILFAKTENIMTLDINHLLHENIPTLTSATQDWEKLTEPAIIDGDNFAVYQGVGDTSHIKIFIEETII